DVTIANAGTASLSVTGLTLSGSGDFSLATPPALPIAVAPGSSALVHVVYAPAQDGPDVGQMTIDSSDPNAPSLKVHLGGNGSSSKTDVTPPARAFGAVRKGQPSPPDLTIATAGAAALHVSGLALPGSGDFSLPMPPAVPLAIAPGASSVLHVA